MTLHPATITRVHCGTCERELILLRGRVPHHKPPEGKPTNDRGHCTGTGQPGQPIGQTARPERSPGYRDHPDDLALRRHLNKALVGIRLRIPMGQAELGKRLGITSPGVCRLEGRPEANFGVQTAQARARALGYRLRLVLYGLDDHRGDATNRSRDDGVQDDHLVILRAMKPTTPQRADAIHHSWLIAYLAAARVAAGISQAAMGRRLGVGPHAVSKAEQELCALLIASLQRRTRALGGQVGYRLTPLSKPETHPTDWAQPAQPVRAAA